MARNKLVSFFEKLFGHIIIVIGFWVPVEPGTQSVGPSFVRSVGE